MLNRVSLFGYLDAPPWETFTHDGLYYIVARVRTVTHTPGDGIDRQSYTHYIQMRAFGHVAQHFVEDAKVDSGVYIKGHLQSYAVKGRKGDTKHFPMIVIDDFKFREPRKTRKKKTYPESKRKVDWADVSDGELEN